MTTAQPSAAPPAREVDPATVRAWLDAGEALIVDVREPDEHARERISSARLVPLSRFNPADIPSTDGRKLVLHCKSGRRSGEALARLMASGSTSACEVFSLKGGIEAWRAAGLPVQSNARVPISLMRQVQIAAGSMVGVGSALALLSPWFLVIPGFVGAGLVFAGATGTCGLAAVLARMPWNRSIRCTSCAG